MIYRVFKTKEVQEFLDGLDDKSKRICNNKLKEALVANPYPGQGLGDKEELEVLGEKAYRLHIGHTWTAFYHVLEGKKQVHVVEILPIGKAHQKYGF